MDYWIRIAEENGITRKQFMSRIKEQGWSPEKAATTPIEIHKPFKQSEQNQHWIELANKNGINYKNFFQRVQRGWDPERAATEPVRKPKPKSITKWYPVAEKNGISRSIFLERIRSYHWSPEKAATTPLRRQSDEYRHWCKIARKNGLSAKGFWWRVNEKFMSLEEAATTPVTPNEECVKRAKEESLALIEVTNELALKNPNNPKYLFRITPHHREIARENGIPDTALEARVYKHGWTVQEAITKPVRKNDLEQLDGYKEYLALAKKNNIHPQTFKHRVEIGFSMEEAATIPTNELRKKRDDQEWIELALKNGIKYTTYIQRTNLLGWTPEQAATTPPLAPGQHLNEEKKQAAVEGFNRFMGKKESGGERDAQAE
ncbi:hypothetical protein BKP37_00680 [Anaerobacillus alkalilacustris]|uniref:Uncharacterized protein n=1 Tax=Anaerobacillus alkalilacustris TaxID=393763 RepID=A0A1S2LX38_9BACI|nr:hypothetical protein [Anaerobacillus alkalilacustris]OIJ17089.1 hypothetical protein BKP37_00680 [Anaerobacillus alkalilacustris]